MKKITTFLLSLACFLSIGAWAEEPTYVAQIGETGYESLQAAIDAAENGAVITLLENFSLEEAITVRGKAVEIRTADYNTAKTPTVGLRVNYMDRNKITAQTIIYFRKPVTNTSTPTEVDRLIVGDFEAGIDVLTAVNTAEAVRWNIGLHDNVTLTKDIVIPDDYGHYLTGGINVKVSCTFDLNGHTLTQSSGANGGWSNLILFDATCDWTIPLLESQTFTLKDSQKTGTIYVPLHAVNATGKTVVNIEDVKIVYGHNCTAGDKTQDDKSGGQAIVVVTANNGGTVNFKGDTRIVRDEDCILTGKYPWVLLPYTGSTMNIESGYYEGLFYSGSPYGTMTITGGTFTSSYIEFFSAEGYAAVKDPETGLYTLAEAVAKIVDGEWTVQYATLKDAFAEADGMTVQLVKNQSLDVTKTDDSLKVPKGVTMTLDLNGYTLASVATAATSSQLILNEGTLTIMDSSDANKDGSGSGKIVVNAKPAWQYDGDPRHTGSYASNGILNKGTLTIESGYLTNATSGSAAYVVDNNSSGSTANLTINGGWLYQWFVAAVRQMANSATYENNVTINGGIVEGYRFEWIQLPGSNASVAPKAKLTVTGGELKSTQASGTQKVFYTYSYGYSRENSYITIEGGIWRGVLSFTEGVDTNNYAIKSTENIEITGGYFTEDIYTFAWWYGDDEAQAKKFIKGGCFAKHPNSSYYRFGVCPGYGVYYNEDPETMVEFPYEVREIPVVELTVTESEIPIKVQEEVLSEIVGDDVLEALESGKPEVRAEAEQAVKEKLHTTETNGLEVWQNYVLGLDGTLENLSVTTEDNNASKIEIVPATDPMPNSGFTVSYKMDYTDAEETTTTLDTLDIELEGEKDPTGVYQVKAILTPDNGGEPIVINTDNKVGVVKAIQPMELAIVSVPWKKLSLSAQSEDIPVADLVKTSTLDEGDMLLVYNGKNYDAWKLNADKVWNSIGIVIKTENGMELQEAPDPTKTTVKRGSGVFLKRKDPSKPYYLCGQVDDSEVVETLPEKINLVANPSVTDFNLNTDGAIFASEGDTIIVPTAAAPIKCTKKDGKWGYLEDYTDARGVVHQRLVNDVKIPAGTGFWYEKGDKSNSSKINWTK